MRIEWSSKTIEDFRRFDDFLSPINRNAAIRAALEIRQQTNILIENPDIGTSLENGTEVRELFIDFGKYGYVVQYEADHDEKIVYILKVWHGREDRGQ